MEEVMGMLKNIANCTFMHPLNRKRRLRAVAFYVTWQITGRLLPGRIVVNWVGGARFMVKPGERGMTGNVYAGFEEYREMLFLLHVLRKEDLFVDVGANAGSYSILAGAVVGANGVAFEPVPDTFTRLIDNIRLNCCENRFICVNRAIGEKTGHVMITTGWDITNRIVTDDGCGTEMTSVDMGTLDDELAGKVPLLLKIDVEGYEVAVLDGARKTLADPELKAVILEVIGDGGCYGYEDRMIFERMDRSGFEACIYDPFHRRLERLSMRKRDSRNVVFVRDRAFVETRIKMAASVKINDMFL